MKLEVVVLAAGQGTRMRSELTKVLHRVAGKPMLAHVVDCARQLGAGAIHVVVGHGAEQVRQALVGEDLNWVLQAEQLGTGHAVLQAMPHVDADSTVLVLYGDVPLIDGTTLAQLIKKAAAGPALLTARLAEPLGYGRILRDGEGTLLGSVEEKDASPEQRAILEVNTGVLAAPAADLNRYLPQVRNANQQGEYYLPDILALAVAEGRTPKTCLANSELEILGVNDRVQLNRVEREFQRRQAEALLREGVAVADADRLDIRGELRCGRDVSIDVNVLVEGEVELADGVRIGPNCVLINSRVGAGAVIHAMSHVEEAEVGPDCSVGPYARLRPGTELASGASIGNFVETKKARIGRGSKANHLAYIGDCDIGEGVNIGAGTITCNYDGINKHRTKIGSGSFVGSNSTLVAPLAIGKESFVAAGSTVTRDVATEELAVGRARQRNVRGWKPPARDGE